MIKLFNFVSEWKQARMSLKTESLGFVPTMGALHDGHLSLLSQSIKENDNTLVTIFVNPTQFNDKNDLDNYPVDKDGDIKKITDLANENDSNVFILFPQYEEIYFDDYTYSVSENQLSNILCGTTRPGHFNGVLTVVMKLLNLAQADKAYFGEKDYQQYLLVKEMSDVFFLSTEIQSVVTVREYDGLAMSSRNQLLNEIDRELAPSFYRTLKQNKPTDIIAAELQNQGFDVDYVEEHFNRRFGAVVIGGIRLIDNLPTSDLEKVK